MNDLIANSQHIPSTVENSLRMSAQQLIAQAEEIVIMTRNDASQATDVVKMIKDRLKNAEGEREKITKPINEGLRQINSRFKTITAPLEQAEHELKGKILKFQQDEERRDREEQARQEAARREAERKERESRPAIELPQETMAAIMEPIIESSFKPTTYGQTGAQSTMQKRWTWELTDIKALAMSHPELISVDSVKVNRLVSAGVRDMPGLRIFQKDILSVR